MNGAVRQSRSNAPIPLEIAFPAHLLDQPAVVRSRAGNLAIGGIDLQLQKVR